MVSVSMLQLALSSENGTKLVNMLHIGPARQAIPIRQSEIGENMRGLSRSLPRGAAVHLKQLITLLSLRYTERSED